MQLEPMKDSKPPFMPCREFRACALLPRRELSRQQRLARYAHERTCHCCILWLIEHLDQDNLPSKIRQNRTRRVQRLRTTHSVIVRELQTKKGA